MVTATVEERLSRIEGAYEHLATKADVSQLEIPSISVRNMPISTTGPLPRAALEPTFTTSINANSLLLGDHATG